MSDENHQPTSIISSPPKKNFGQALSEMFSLVESDFDFSKYKTVTNMRQHFDDEKGAFGEMAGRSSGSQKKTIAE